MLNLSNQAAVEALCSGTYLENYLDTIETLPDDLQRNLSQMHELDIKSRGVYNCVLVANLGKE
jgi:inhibitor-of-growth protein 1